MTDDAWRKASLHELLGYLEGRLSHRKTRLIACACAREARPMGVAASAEAIRLAERFADGEATPHELASMRFGGQFLPGHAAWPVCWSPDEDYHRMLQRCIAWATGFYPGTRLSGDFRAVEARMADIVRDVAGDPADVRPIEPAWRAWDGGTVVKMARAIYDERAYDQMPILADALEEAGCADPALLDHCRVGRGHVRGCWVLDAVLGLL
jgi:hypothetical protein